ncbi:MAG: ankyrin repeat domain-containing protein [Candidatus Babeliales bacterium]
MRIYNAIVLAMIMITVSSLVGRAPSQEHQNRCDKRLIDAIGTNSISKVKRALSHSPNVNCVIDVYVDNAHAAYRRLQKTTPLILALEGHWSGGPADSRIIKLLIHKGADVNGSHEVEETVLGAAVRYLNGSEEHLEVFRLLLSKGADVNKANKQGLFPLNIAIGNLKPKLVRILLEYPHAVHVIEDAWTVVERMQLQAPEQVAEIAGMLSVYSIRHGIVLKNRIEKPILPVPATAEVPAVRSQENRPVVHVEQYIPSDDRAMKCDAPQACGNTMQQAAAVTPTSQYKNPPVSKSHVIIPTKECAPCKELTDIFVCKDIPFWEIDYSKAIHVPAQEPIDWHEIFGCKSIQSQLHEIFREQTDTAECDQMTTPPSYLTEDATYAPIIKEFVPCKELIDALSCEDASISGEQWLSYLNQ